ncbi:polysaccharide pyruvyl transferase family protein [Herbiconiux sp. VKM Ac-2851]|uniref:polysaccharide pyruvyl transferase family protein n=1 Tax=Herbiconiux sp. VKM Ac-2851 TaxID=2739025 RepID=UPI001564D147|nr:polysaccharide pyruvyl transferase family protein [Herbiconiux sp. VKM Ac-2851]NQX35592.1 polysaccharide pyruvyl transferase family protein [Herbiconiux sp. VKM Ac-2851]
MSRRIFVRGTGQEDNIGDVVLRRAMFDRLREAGELHIYLADSSKDFIAALKLGKNDRVYRDMKQWKVAALKSVLRRPTWFVDKPGEVLLTEDIYQGQRALLPVIIAIRARGGRVLRLGIGQRASNEELTPKFRRLYRLSNSVLWRDSASARAFGLGGVMPDWGFESAPGAGGDQERDLLLVSYRGDRPTLADETVTAIRLFADQKGLKVAVVTQVGRDDERTAELAEQLGGTALLWEAGVTHAQQEEKLRILFRRAAVVVSDRLHVLIIGATEGAVPINLTDEPDIKVGRHFDAIGYEKLSILTVGSSSAELVSRMMEQSGRGSELGRAVERARDRVRALSAEALVLRPSAASELD